MLQVIYGALRCLANSSCSRSRSTGSFPSFYCIQAVQFNRRSRIEPFKDLATQPSDRVQGFTKEQLRHFSQRREEIEAAMQKLGASGAKASECQPPIARLREHLRHGHPFPSCPEGGSAYARPASSYYDLCPAGTVELPEAQFGAAASATRFVHYGIGDGGYVAQRNNGGVQTQIPPKVCVGRRVGQGIVYLPAQGGGDRGGPGYQAHVVGYYHQLVVLPAYGSPRVIDVYIDNARYMRVRW